MGARMGSGWRSLGMDDRMGSGLEVKLIVGIAHCKHLNVYKNVHI